MDSELSKIFAIHQIASLELGDLSGRPILCQITNGLVLKVKGSQIKMSCVKILQIEIQGILRI